jgi:hypothetical protein
VFDNDFLRSSSWGWLPILAPVTALGFLVTSLAVDASIDSQPYAMLIFWAGILIITLPVGWRLIDQSVEFREALVLVILTGEMLFLVSVQISSTQSYSYDGYLHWRTASDIVTTQHLFSFNNLLPVSPYYPGLEIVTTALVNLTGLPIFTAGSIVVFVARFIMITSLFLIFCELSGSVRAAGLGCLIYMGSSTFVFFDTQFAYESLSLPLAALVLWLVLKRSQLPARQQSNWIFLAVLVGVMVTITHHLMSYFLTGILLLWTGVANIKKQRGMNEYVPFRIAVFLLFFVLAWLGIVAEITVGYLAPYVSDTLATLLRFISGYRGNRVVFSASQSAGVLSERMVAVASVLSLMLGEALGLWVWWKSFRNQKALQSAFAIVLVMVSLAYPMLPLLHLNNSTWEVADRLASFIFIGLAFVIGLGLAKTWSNPNIFQVQRWVFMPALAVIICAGIIGGSHPAARLPGPYLVEADNRSVDSYGRSAADWAATYLGPRNNMAADRVQSVLMGSFGQQTMIYGGSNGLNTSPIFLAPQLKNSDFRNITINEIRYLVIDERITQGPPLFGYYFENWEQQVAPSRVPVDPAMLDKFNHIPGVNRIFDNGNIRIYDIGGISIAQPTN